ncbi:hypothetical protein HanRHA438_Chr09g0408031 [Helianthus annuus]|nr:hypothetical protein HanIR_Chr09g0427171 [Helianthus annuus]KAJ0888984.1 hypothetical protein HanRHA438_Chr09g0408031 [Helianthus annuus]
MMGYLNRHVHIGHVRMVSVVSTIIYAFIQLLAFWACSCFSCCGKLFFFLSWLVFEIVIICNFKSIQVKLGYIIW